MCFQLGRPRLSKFKNMIAAVEDHDWAKMADEMEDSTWFKQTPERAQRLIDRVDKQQAMELPV
jgi:lysozyme